MWWLRGYLWTPFLSDCFTSEWNIRYNKSKTIRSDSSLIAIPVPDASEILVAENNNGAYIWRVEKYTKEENQTFIFVDLYDFDLNASDRKFDFILTQIIKSNPTAPKNQYALLPIKTTKVLWRSENWVMPHILLTSDAKAGIGNNFMAIIGNNTRFTVANSSIIRYNLKNFYDIIRVALAFFFVLRYNCK